MSNNVNTLIRESAPTQEKANELMSRMFDAARPDHLYSAPTVQGQYAVITASEVIGGLGYGYGGGGGFAPENADGTLREDAPNGGFGGGGGGGGSVVGRPVAVISIGPDGVRVEPVFDTTKIIITLLTSLAAIFVALGRINKQAKQLTE